MMEKEYKHELIRPNEKLPVFVWIHNPAQVGYANYIVPHWHQAIEISYTLAGKIDEFIVEGKTYQCDPGKILVVNSQEIHSIKVKLPTKDNRALTVIYDYNFIKELYPEIKDEWIRINNQQVFTAEQRKVYKELQSLLDGIVKLYNQEENKFKNIEMSLELLRVLKLLLVNFAIADQKKRAQTNKTNKQLYSIVEFIKNNYQEISSLEDVAEYCHLSKEYLARFFKKNMGITVGQYIAEIKAKNAYEQIGVSQKNLTQIALDAGFSGIRTMDRALIRVYGKKASEIKKVNQSH